MTELARALRAHFRAGRQPPAQHVPVEDLVAYRSEMLRPEKVEQVRDHLVACEECSDLLLDLAELEDTGGLADAASELETAAAWKRQRERLFPGRSPGRDRWPVQMGGWLAAACLALIAGSLGMELRELRQASTRLYEQDLPRVIVSGSDVRSLDDELPVLRFDAGKPGFLLLLMEGDPPFESYRAELLTDDGRSLVREGLSASEDLLLIPVSPELLPPGRVRVVVSGLREGRFATVGEYALRVEHP